MVFTKKTKIILKIILFLCVAALIFALVAYLLTHRFNPLRNQPDEIVVYKYGTTHTLTPADEEFGVLYQQLHDAWEVEWNDRRSLDGYKGNLLGYAECFFDSGLAIQVKYHVTQISGGIGTSGYEYDDIVFLLDYPKTFPPDISDMEKSDVMNLPVGGNYYPVYYASHGSLYRFSFAHYRFPREAKEYILQNFND